MSKVHYNWTGESLGCPVWSRTPNPAGKLKNTGETEKVTCKTCLEIFKNGTQQLPEDFANDCKNRKAETAKEVIERVEENMSEDGICLTDFSEFKKEEPTVKPDDIWSLDDGITIIRVISCHKDEVWGEPERCGGASKESDIWEIGQLYELIERDGKPVKPPEPKDEVFARIADLERRIKKVENRINAAGD